MAKTFFARSGYASRHTEAKREYRFLTLEECKNLTGRVPFLDADDRVREMKITSVRTYKRRPDVVVRWKYGLYVYGQRVLRSDEDNNLFIVEVLPGILHEPVPDELLDSDYEPTEPELVFVSATFQV